jgi:hypothetical protein
LWENKSMTTNPTIFLGIFPAFFLAILWYFSPHFFWSRPTAKPKPKPKPKAQSRAGQASVAVGHLLS